MILTVFYYFENSCLKWTAVKSKFVPIDSRKSLKRLTDIRSDQIRIGSSVTEWVYKTKNLGIMFDVELAWTGHVNLSHAWHMTN